MSGSCMKVVRKINEWHPPLSLCPSGASAIRSTKIIFTVVRILREERRELTEVNLQSKASSCGTLSATSNHNKMDVNRIFCAEQIEVPKDLPNIMKEYTKELIKSEVRAMMF